ncbi:rab guanine nucleotide exchange factor S2 [Mortierella claussenii]|nr:rab guanine nucleotide exchange factor S2 [Mortierella claussenii]
MSVTCNNCGAAVELTSSLNHQQLHLPNDPLVPFVKAQIDNLTAQNSTLVAENDSLASKLVESTEGRMDLDSQLNIAQMELQAAQSDLKTLRAKERHYDQLMGMVASGQLIEKKDVQPVIENLAYESQRRSQIETSKMKLESELEDLSRSLFEEANRMVNEERQATYMAGKKIEALERQLDEVLDLCKSERDQLVELKLRMGKLSDEKDTVQRERDAIEFAFLQLQQHVHQQQQHLHSPLHSASSPTSMHHHMSATAAARRGMPANSPSGLPLSIGADITVGSRKHVQQIMQYDARQHRSSASSVKSKTDSCYFSDEDHPGSHLLNDPNDDRIPSLGFHLWDPSFIEFKSYIESIFDVPKPNAAPDTKVVQQSTTSSVASSGLTSMYSFSIMSKSTNTVSAPTTNAMIPINNLLSNCRLLKKMSSEDVEATLRFEPGNLLSWTQRKRLMTAITENTLVVEAVPMTSTAKESHSPVISASLISTTQAGITGTTATASITRQSCALCGHGITTPLYYQYRLTDTANESRTICPYCRTRLTSVCTFYSVLRMISKRIISSTTTPEKLYLDFLRIRLSMFLARCGVGIITGDEVKQKRESTRNSQLAVITSSVTRSNSSNNSNNCSVNNSLTSSKENAPSAATVIKTSIAPAQATFLSESPSNASAKVAISLIKEAEEEEGPIGADVTRHHDSEISNPIEIITPIESTS